MLKIYSDKVDEMDRCLQRLMSWRMKLTRVHTTKQNSDTDGHTNEQNSDFELSDDDLDYVESEKKDVKVKIVAKYKPPIRYKEHALSHISEDIRALG